MSNLLFATVTTAVEDATWSPRKALQSKGIDHDRVVNVINVRLKKKWTGGLCRNFCLANPEYIDDPDWYGIIPPLLAELNDRTDLLRKYNDEEEQGFDFSYGWQQGDAERKLLLAFMLTWLGDEND